MVGGKGIKGEEEEERRKGGREGGREGEKFERRLVWRSKLIRHNLSLALAVYSNKQL